MYRAQRDTRNSPLWNPSSPRLANLQDDEAGRMAAFRARFGKSYDADLGDGRVERKKKDEGKQSAEDAAAVAAEEQEEEDNLLDLISSFGQEEGPPKGASTGSKKDQKGKK